MNIDSGFLTLGSWRKVPIRAHWSVPLIVLFLGGLAWVPVQWAVTFAMILLHEMGHAWWVLRFKQRMVSIDLYGVGGLCRWKGQVSPIKRALISWGGVLVQLIILAITLLIVAIFGSPTGETTSQIVYACTWTNLHLIILNLLPIRPLDGAGAWPLFPLLFRRWKRGRRKKDRAKPHAAFTVITGERPEREATPTQTPAQENIRSIQENIRSMQALDRADRAQPTDEAKTLAAQMFERAKEESQRTKDETQ